MDLVINSWSIYSQNSCTNYTGGVCQQWTSISSLSKTNIEEIGVIILWNASVFVLIVSILLWIVKVLFSKLNRK